jgi:hypothetical protein
MPFEHYNATSGVVRLAVAGTATPIRPAQISRRRTGDG